jgi:hypothetical protein
MNERFDTESYGEGTRQMQAEREKRFKEQLAQFEAEQKRRRQLAKERAGMTAEQRRLQEKSEQPEATDD